MSSAVRPILPSSTSCESGHSPASTSSYASRCGENVHEGLTGLTVSKRKHSVNTPVSIPRRPKRKAAMAAEKQFVRVARLEEESEVEEILLESIKRKSLSNSKRQRDQNEERALSVKKMAKKRGNRPEDEAWFTLVKLDGSIDKVPLEVLHLICKFMDPHESYCLSVTCQSFQTLNMHWTMPSMHGRALETLNRKRFGAEQVKFAKLRRCAVCGMSFAGEFYKDFAVYGHKTCFRQFLVNKYYLFKREKELVKEAKEAYGFPSHVLSGYSDRSRSSYTYRVVWEENLGILPKKWTVEGVCRTKNVVRARWERSESDRTKFAKAMEENLFHFLRSKERGIPPAEVSAPPHNLGDMFTENMSSILREEKKDQVQKVKQEKQQQAKEARRLRKEALKAWQAEQKELRKHFIKELGVSSLKELNICLANGRLFQDAAVVLTSKQEVPKAAARLNAVLVRTRPLSFVIRSNKRNMERFNLFYRCASECAEKALKRIGMHQVE